MNDRLFYVAATPFEAARRVDILPEGHRARRLHGHSFLAKLSAELPEDWAQFSGAEAEALQGQLASVVAPLDYALLNDEIAVPTDENIARWIRSHIDVPGVQSVGVQSTSDQGVDLDDAGQAHIWRRFRFEAAHKLPNVAEGHKCGRMHGHGFEVILHANQDLGQRDMGVDFDHLAECWAPLQNKLHLHCLNDISGLENPTSEVLAGWIWDRLKLGLPELSWVTVYETVTAGCHYDGAEYRIWKEQRFESAVRFTDAPATDPRRRLHGHSYIIRLHLCAPLDQVLGWTIDYGDVKEQFKPIYNQIDHHLLNDLPDIGNADTGSLLRWLKWYVHERLPQLDRIDLFETPGCGATLCRSGGAPILPT